MHGRSLSHIAAIIRNMTRGEMLGNGITMSSRRKFLRHIILGQTVHQGAIAIAELACGVVFRGGIPGHI